MTTDISKREAAARPGLIRRLRDSDIWWSFTRSKTAIAAALILAVLILTALFAPLIAVQNPYDAAQLDMWKAELPPIWQEGSEWPYLLGTDTQGRDMLSAILYGTRISIVIGVASVALSLVIGMSAGTIWQKRFGAASDLVGGTLWQYLGGAILMTLASFAFETRTVTINGELVFAMVWLVLVLSIGAIFLLMVMIREGEMSKVASLFYLVPAVTAVIAWLLFGESLSLVQIAGMAVATIGVGLATAQPRRS
ncbi:EamA family transporter [Rhizobiaceae sp. 2RAB30]